MQQRKPYKAPSARRVTSELNIFDKVNVEVNGKTFPNIFIKFIDADVSMCLSAEQARMLGQVLILRAEALDEELASRRRTMREARP